MISSKGIQYNDEKTKILAKTDGEMRPIAIQIFGSDSEAMACGAKYASQIADIVDINMGCPAPKVTKNGDGSKLLLDLEKAYEIIDVVVKNSSVPVTLKLRKGWDEDNVVAVDLAQMAEKLGVSAITIHGRTRQEFYSCNVDLEIIKKVKASVKIPVIGNGDIIDEKSALDMFEKTGVDGIMIGRGAMGNPWIFEKLKYFLETGEYLPEVSLEERLQVIKQHINLITNEKGESAGIKEFRKHLAAYTKNLPNSSFFRNSINKIETKDELEMELDKYWSELYIGRNRF